MERVISNPDFPDSPSSQCVKLAYQAMEGSLEQKGCEICGQPAEQTPLGTLLCAVCRGRYREFRCSVCGQRMLVSDPIKT